MTETIKRSLRESPKARWTAMVLVSLSAFGAYYFNYALSPVKPMLESALGWTSSDFGTYTSSYAWFNVYFFMLIFSGIILDKLGIRLTGLSSALLMLIGTGINYWAVVTDFPDAAQVALPLIGEIKTQVLYSSLGFALFGVGTEASGITLTKAIVRWFKGKELALAMGLQMSIARMGTALALAVALPLAINFHYSSPILWAFVLMFIGVIAFVMYIFLDLKLEKSEKEIEVDEEEPFRLRDILSIIKNRGFWYIAILCVLFYSAVFPFLYYATDFMINKYRVAPGVAGIIPSLLPFGTIFLTPLFGGIYDKKGKGATIMIIGALLLILVHGVLAIPFLDNWILASAMVVVLGIAFSLVPSAMWPAVPKIIPEKRLGTAYAVIFWIQNIGLMLVPLLLGIVLDATNPSVATNKALIRSSVEQSYSTLLAQNNITVDADEMKRAVETTTTTVVDSVVKTSFYKEIEHSAAEKEDVKNEILKQVATAGGAFETDEDKSTSINKIQQIITEQTYQVIEKNKLNIRYNYQADILIFAMLGVLSLIFAFLLKREDRKKGYGLELPNIKE
ncbi:Predicted arabinose efflux permease, MFS family [Tangfeifania diversioriginum]|uniref:Lysosomal dipeptide transporter MFSD1 n=1 Tax=Tangfeifania diversioriginum TaxID=1168035 RepID=A0A1M6JWP1_9BACT|nr:MFS transporter [Tangfeifania diversioriginum]SHJ51089.1 Predicted arabinose efflux permease, MFS family [Tangfeifania diversioriginum]